MVRRLSTKRPTAGQKPTTAPSVPQAAEQPKGDGSPPIPPDFGPAFATAYQELTIEGEGEVVPLAALRMTRAKEAHRV